MPDTPPEQIGKYRLTDLLGQGAMGVVYRALDPLLNRHVAIKLMGQGITADTTLRDRFLREAQAAGSLQHPNIITIYDFGETDGHLFIAMEYVEGADLSELIERKDPLPLSAKLDIIIDVLQALHYAHSRKVVHRDIKPANIRVAVDGRAKLMDFGIARLESSDLTKSGMLIGTPNYMAPEQVTSGQVSPATDIFSLGVVLYEFLSYRRTFDGDTLHAVLYKIVSEQPPSLDMIVTGVPAPLRRIVEKALAKDPKDRYESAGAMAKELTDVRTALSQGKPVTISTRMTPLRSTVITSARRRRVPLWAGIGAGVVIVGAALAVTLMSRRGPSSAPGAPATPAAAGAPPALGAPVIAAAPLTQVPSAPARGGVAASAPVTPTPAPRPGATPRQSAPSAQTSAAAPLAQSAPAPSAPQATTPAPVTSAPAPTPGPPPSAAPTPSPPEDPRPEIEQLVTAYSRAIESHSIAEIRRFYPGLTGAQQQGWEQFFQSTRTLRAHLAITRLDVTGSSADLSVSGSYDYDAGSGRTEHQPVSFRATAAQEGSNWRFRTIR